MHGQKNEDLEPKKLVTKVSGESKYARRRAHVPAGAPGINARLVGQHTFNMGLNMNAVRIKHLAKRAMMDPSGAVRHFLRNAALASDLKRKDGRSAPPGVLSLKLLDRCNLRCSMCDQFGPRGRLLDKGKRSPDMPIDKIESLLEEAGEFKPSVYLTGGEPMLHPEILEIIEMITVGHGLSCEMNTNGLLVGSHAAELVGRCKLDILTVSAHGPDSKTNDAVVGVKGALDRVTASIQAVRLARSSQGSLTPLIRVNCVITRETNGRLRDMVEFARIAGADQINIQHPIYTTDEMIARHEKCFVPMFKTGSPGLAGYLNTAAGLDPDSIQRQLAGMKNGSDCLALTFYPKVAGEDIEAYYTDPFHHFRREGCSMPWLKATIAPNGNVTPCLDLIVGNAFEEGLRAVWNGDKIRAFRKALAERKLFPGCLRCCHRTYQ